MTLILASTAFFLLLYPAVVSRVGAQPFHVSFKLTRGAASVGLTAIGCYGLWHWFGTWPQAFLQRQVAGSVEWYLVIFVTGHFLADFLLLVYGLMRHGSVPRTDLMAHHLLGLVGSAFVLYYDVGAVFYVVALTTEVMPVTSGFAAWSELRRNSGLARLATKLRLVVLAAWRLPLWLILALLVLQLMSSPQPDELVGFAHKIALSCLAVIICLDIYWLMLCIRALRAPEQGWESPGRNR
jgi:hypothetical protein